MLEVVVSCCPRTKHTHISAVPAIRVTDCQHMRAICTLKVPATDVFDCDHIPNFRIPEDTAETITGCRNTSNLCNLEGVARHEADCKCMITTHSLEVPADIPARTNHRNLDECNSAGLEHG